MAVRCKYSNANVCVMALTVSCVLLGGVGPPSVVQSYEVRHGEFFPHLEEKSNRLHPGDTGPHYNEMQAVCCGDP